VNNEIEIDNSRNEILDVLYKKSTVIGIFLYLIVLIGGMFTFNSIFELDYIPSESMENTIQVGDYTIINKIAYALKNQPKRGDVISFISPDERTPYVKRIIGLPNDTIYIKKGIVYVNDVELKEDYTIPFEEDNWPFVVPENEYFVLGDNRENSNDSRYWKYKYVKEGDILGKVIISFNIKDFRASFY
jgi:signal peptidase I